MQADEQIEQERLTNRADDLSRISVRRLASATGIMSIVAQGLALTGIGAGDAHVGPVGAIVGQQLWNAAQVGLLLLLCMWLVHRRWWMASLSIATVACLPFAIYVLSPGGWVLTAILLLTCFLANADDVSDLGITVADAPARGTPLLAKFELLAFVANLLCSMYNYTLTPHLPPYWGSIFTGTAANIGFTADLTQIDHALYTAGLNDLTVPPYIKTGLDPNNLGALLFALIWTILPFIYVLYFALLAKLAKDSPATRVQQVLCVFGILHFLFLTDVVDYRFGRGIVNPLEDFAHWVERAAWGIALLLPVYQKLATAQWRRGNGPLGVVVHYVVAAWLAGFVIYHVFLYGLPHLLGTSQPVYQRGIGYFGALVLMTLLYGFMVLAMRSKHIFAFEEASSCRRL
jgi:hypothetical protein